MKGEGNTNTEKQMSTIHNGEGISLNWDDCGPGMGIRKVDDLLQTLLMDSLLS